MSHSSLQFTTSTWSSTSTSLLRRVAGMDDRGWARFVELYLPLIFHWCRKSGLQDQDAHDVSQEVFRAIYLRIDTFDRDQPGHSFRAWLSTVTRNKIIDHQRSSTRRSKIEDQAGDTLKPQESGTPQDDAVVELNLQDERLIEAVETIRKRCSDHTWQAFWDVTVRGLEPAIVSEELGMSPSSVYQAVSRIMRRLRTEMAKTEAK